MFKFCQYFYVLFINYHEPYSQIFKMFIYLFRRFVENY